MVLNLKNRLFSFLKTRLLNTRRSKKNFKDKHKRFEHNIYITTDDNKKIGAYLLKPEFVDKNTRFAIILHGAGTSRECYRSKSCVNLLHGMGYCLLIPDYRGFADSEGDFEANGVNLDILACFKYLTSSFGARKIHMIGHSLGTGIIAEYCRYIKNNNIQPKYHPDKVVMISPFTSIVAVGKGFYTWRIIDLFLPWFRTRINKELEYDTLSNAKYVDVNNLFLYHGIKDRIVPYEHSIAISKRYRSHLKLTNHNHITIIGDEDVWNDIHLNISRN